MATWAELAQSVLTQGISAAAEVQVARYQANDPTPNQRGNGTVTGRQGQPTYSPLGDTLAATFSNPTNLVLLGVAVGLVVWLVKRS